jgi:hypothetical protein
MILAQPCSRPPLIHVGQGAGAYADIPRQTLFGTALSGSTAQSFLRHKADQSIPTTGRMGHPMHLPAAKLILTLVTAATKTGLLHLQQTWSVIGRKVHNREQDRHVKGIRLAR